MASNVAVELRDNLKCIAGSKAICDLSLFSECKITESLDGNNSCSVTVPREFADKARLRYVLHTTDTIGFVREFRISNIVYDPTGAMATMEAVAAHQDLATAGLVRDVAYGFAIAAVTLTPAQWINNFVLTNLAADGLTWVSAGTIEPTTPLSLSFVGYTRLQLIREIESQLGCEFVLRRNGDTGYVIDLLTSVGSTATPLRVTYGRNLVGVEVTYEDSRLATVVQPTGDTPSGGTGPADLKYNAWRVAAISGTGPYWVSLEDPAGGAGPIAFDDEVNGMYLINAGSGQAITDSRASDNGVQVASVSGINVGNHLSISRSATDDDFFELTNPAAVTQYGRAVSALPVSGLRGERNFVANGGFEISQGQWNMANISLGNQPLFGWMVGRSETTDLSGNVNGAVASSTITSLALKNLPANGWLRRWDLIEVAAETYTVTTETVVSSAYQATLPISPVLARAITRFQVPSGTIMSYNAGSYFDADAAVGASSVVMYMNGYGSVAFATGDIVQVLRNVSSGNVMADGDFTVDGDGYVSITLATSLPTFADSVALKWDTCDPWINQGSGTFQTGGVQVISASGTSATLYFGSGYSGTVVKGGFNFTFSGRIAQQRTLTGTINQFPAGGTVTQTLSSAFTQTARTDGIMRWASSSNVSKNSVSAPEDLFNAQLYNIRYTSISGTSITFDGKTGLYLPAFYPPACKTIAAGTTIVFSGQTFTVTTPVQASGTGTVTATITSQSTTGIADNAVVSIRRPANLLDADGGGSQCYRIDTAYNTAPTISTPAAAGPTAYIGVPSGGTVFVTASGAFTLWNRSTSAVTVSGTVVLVNKTTNAVVGYTVTNPTTFSLAAGAYYHGTLRLLANITTSGVYEVRIIAGRSTTGGSASIGAYVRWGMIHVGPEAAVPYVNGSHANKLWKLANLSLAQKSVNPRTLKCRFIDLKRLGVPVGTEQITLGANVNVEDVGMTGRIVSYTLDLADEANNEVTLSTIPKRITNFLV